jgi:hypothetical protein
MHNLTIINEYYKKFIKDLSLSSPEGVYFVNLDLLYHFDLLHFQPNYSHKDPTLTSSFYVFESQEKITLFNQEFIIWIIPVKEELSAFTYTLIALNSDEREPQFEVAFITSGVYNTSSLVLKILEKFLIEIQETETTLANIQKTT